MREHVVTLVSGGSRRELIFSVDDERPVLLTDTGWDEPGKSGVDEINIRAWIGNDFRSFNVTRPHLALVTEVGVATFLHTLVWHGSIEAAAGALEPASSAGWSSLPLG